MMVRDGCWGLVVFGCRISVVGGTMRRRCLAFWSGFEVGLCWELLGDGF